MAMHFPLAAVLLLLSAVSKVKAAAAANALPGCSDKCGDLTVPYPFGMKEGCYLRKEFFINCDHSTQPPTANLRKSNIVVTDISLEPLLWHWVLPDQYSQWTEQCFCTGEKLRQSYASVGFNPCSYAFIAEQGQFNFNPSSFKQLNATERIPADLNWAIGNETDPCDQAEIRKDFVCKANSECFNRDIKGSAGYLCRCSPGFEGNPYHPDGCKDIDDCKASNPCLNGECVNQLFPQNYTCACHKGYKKDRTNDQRCIKTSKIVLLLTVSLGVSMSVLVLFLGISWICWGMKKRELVKLKEKHFKENGGLLLLQQLASRGSSMKTTKIFNAEELEKATNNYHESRVLGEGGYGTVYKGILPDDTVVAIKKSKGTGAATQCDQFVNEVIVLSQINHRNVVKLLGCCLETEEPLLVYEFITHGTLYEHLHRKRSSLPFELRMKIATQSAEALSHLHSSISTPIIHRDVKTANILLDDEYTVKL
ncbi:hypothetical protein ACLB2K_023688 [Fragaria x ananassa]